MQYVVQAGDTLSIIAAKFGTTVEAIVQANNLSNPNVIYVGQVLTIPTGTVPPAPSPIPPPTSTCPRLARGDRGPAVRRLQSLLERRGIDVGVIDGIYGPKTEAAVRYFQQLNNLPVTGIADVSTWAALGANCGVVPPIPIPPTPVPPTPSPEEHYCPILRLGSVGPAVRLLQRLLKSKGLYTGVVDGDFGGRTLRAVRQFQRQERLPVTGVVDGATWRALGVSCNLEPKPPSGTPISTKVGRGIRHILYTDKKTYRRGETVDITLSKTNITDDEITLRYRTSQIIEINVKNYAGRTVWTYSNNMNFAQYSRVITIYPDGTQVIKAEWEQVNNNGNQVVSGTYTIEVTNLATNVTTSVEIEIR